MTWGEDRKIVQTLKKLREECEASLRRLEVEAIDLYQIHWPVPDEEIEEGWSTMADLQREGKVRWIGVSNFKVSQMQRASGIAKITSLQPPYSMVNRTYETDVLPWCKEHDNWRPQLFADGERFADGRDDEGAGCGDARG
jgi:aryl-alcohol dehydrogenase-like predicted oxidoreductase